jgi:hypothetical protein
MNNGGGAVVTDEMLRAGEAALLFTEHDLTYEDLRQVYIAMCQARSDRPWPDAPDRNSDSSEPTQNDP